MIVAILQARTSSSRLPGKVLRSLLGVPMMARQLERIRQAKTLDRIVVATSAEPSDDAIADLCAALGVACFRGSLEDVLDRFYQAARDAGADHVVRLTADCPLIDPEVIDRVVEGHLAGGFDYTSNVERRTFPDGLDTEVMTLTCLETAWREATLRSEREHVTPFIRNRSDRFTFGHVVDPEDRSTMRWTVDEPADLAFVTAVYEALYPATPQFRMADVLAWLDAHPTIREVNAGIPMNAGYERSLRDDMTVAPPHAEERD